MYETFALRLQELLKELTQGANIPCDKIVYRVKTLDSFLEKIERKLYTSPFEEIKDLAGVRVVTYYLDDVERVRQLIYQEFTVDEQHSVDKITHLGAEEFGYRSVGKYNVMGIPFNSFPYRQSKYRHGLLRMFRTESLGCVETFVNTFRRKIVHTTNNVQRGTKTDRLAFSEQIPV